jgi:hypothetical protein
MKLKALWIPMVFVAALRAVPVPICTSGAGSVPVFSISSTSGEVADYTIDCSGVPEPSPPPTIDIDAKLNVPILNTGGWFITDGTTSTPGVLDSIVADQVDFDGVPFSLSGGSENYTIEGIFVNPRDQGAGFTFEETDTIIHNFSIDTTNVVEEEVGVNAAPEPSMLLLGAVGLGAVWFARKMRRV